jgi:hypothetical protein
MLYKQQPAAYQLRHHCRNPRCAGKLKTPTENPRDAFCCKGCECQFYGRRCRVCEALFPPKTKRRRVCGRAKCRYRFKRHPEDFYGASYPSGPVAHNASRNPIKPGIKNGAKPGRPFRIVAGPADDLDPINFTSPPEPRRASGPVLITPTTPPLNIVGGYLFPGALTLDNLGVTP